MLTKTAVALGALRPKSGKFGGYVRTSLVVAACLAIAGPALAASPYDGNWSVVIRTSGGACDPSFRYGITISNGAVLNSSGSPADVQGRVTPGGAVRVSVQAGGQWASGSGRLSRSSGGGTWRGEGSAGACEGTWTAARNSAVKAEGPGRPIYNYAPAQAAPGYQYTQPAGYCPPGMYLSFDGAQYICR